VLEVREPLVARSAGDPPSEARGNVVCRHLDGSEPFRVLVMPLPTSLEIVDAADVEREVELARIGDSVRVRAEIPGAVGDEITVEVTIHLLRS
jgi:HSP20 family molecular chaperone IbpA